MHNIYICTYMYGQNLFFPFTRCSRDVAGLFGRGLLDDLRRRHAGHGPADALRAFRLFANTVGLCVASAIVFLSSPLAHHASLIGLKGELR